MTTRVESLIEELSASASTSSPAGSPSPPEATSRRASMRTPSWSRRRHLARQALTPRGLLGHEPVGRGRQRLAEPVERVEAAPAQLRDTSRRQRRGARAPAARRAPQRPRSRCASDHPRPRVLRALGRDHLRTTRTDRTSSPTPPPEQAAHHDCIIMGHPRLLRPRRLREHGLPPRTQPRGGGHRDLPRAAPRRHRVRLPCSRRSPPCTTPEQEPR